MPTEPPPNANRCILCERELHIDEAVPVYFVNPQGQSQGPSGYYQCDEVDACEERMHKVLAAAAVKPLEHERREASE